METVSAKLEVHFSTRNATFQTYPNYTQVFQGAVKMMNTGLH